MGKSVPEIVVVSNPDKILFPRSGITKKEFVNYYAQIADVMLPYLKDRPVALQRYPDGIMKEGFFQKEIPHYFPDFVKRVNVKASGSRPTYYAMINNKESLVYIANHASIPIHTWQSRRKKLNHPDQVIWDLDPAGVGFDSVKTGARLLKFVLEEFGLPVYLKSTGSRGLHLVIPIKTQYTYKEVKAFSRGLSEYMAAKIPQLFTTEHRKEKRGKKVFLDYLRNDYEATAAAPYCVRPLEGAPVAAPVLWEEIEDKSFSPQQFNIRNMMHRLTQKGDVWEGFYENAQSLTKAMKRLQELLEHSPSLKTRAA